MYLVLDCENFRLSECHIISYLEVVAICNKQFIMNLTYEFNYIRVVLFLYIAIARKSLRRPACFVLLVFISMHC